MKKSLKILLPILALGLFGFIAYKVITKINHKSEVAGNIAIMPDISYKNVSTGKPFSKDDLDAQKPTVLVWFNSECEYCQHEAWEIQQNSIAFKECQILFISEEKPEIIKSFSKEYNLNQYGHFYFLFDSRNHFSTTFDVNSFPSLIIYNEKGQLLKKIKGQVKVSKILELLEK